MKRIIRSASKKVSATILSLMILMGSFGILAQAAISGSITYHNSLSGIYIQLASGYTFDDYYRKEINNTVAYCVQPGIRQMGNAYTGEEISNDLYNRFSLADYWGRFVMNGVMNNEDINNFYVQMYIWELLGDGPTVINGTGISMEGYQTWKAAVEPWIQSFFDSVSFAFQNVTLNMGESVTLTDLSSSGALGYYKIVSNSANVDIVMNDNKLVITANNSSASGVVRLRYDIDVSYDRPAYYWTADSGQDVMSVGISDPKIFDINIEVIPMGTLKLAKTSEDNNISGLQFRVQSADNTFNEVLTTNSSGAFEVDLVAGKYTVTEINTPGRYVQPVSQTVTIEAGKTSNVSFNNVLKKFRVQVAKVDKENTAAQGDASLAGAVYGFYDKSGSLLDRYTTNANGSFTTSYYVCGDGYYIQEITPSPGYTLDTTKYPIEKTGAGNYTVELNSLSLTVQEQVIRGGLRVEKWDYEIDENSAQGNATLEGAVFDIYNRSGKDVIVNNTSYASGQIVATITTDAGGVAQTGNKLLPYGSYEVIERTPPTGYLQEGKLSQTFQITADGEIVTLNTSETAIKNNPARGDLKAVKISDGDGKRLAGVPFRLTSVTTGESHVVVTDANGQFDTSSAWNPHSQNTNRGETDQDGIWFGDISALDDTVGALLYDTYLIEELRCEANEPYELLPPFEVTVYRNNMVVDLGTLTNDYIVIPQLYTTATYANTDSHDAYIGVETTIVDTVEYYDAKPGQEYTLVGTLMDKATGKPVLVEGQTVTASTTFTPRMPYGSVEVEFSFNSLALAGKDVVVFEKLYADGIELNAHEDIEDEGQSIHFIEPVIGTMATDEQTGTHDAFIGEDTVLLDTVEYSGLKAGEEYTVSGVLMDKETGEPVFVEGEPVTASTTFVAEASEGTAEVAFSFNSVSLVGMDVVVFEKLYVANTEIANHEDIEDEGQTIAFIPPEIGTTAHDAASGNHSANVSKQTTIVDSVAYSGLRVGQEYTVSGILMNKATGEPLLEEGAEITSSVTFTAKASEGSIDLKFIFDSSALQGEVVVVFETLYIGEIEVAVHTDINDFEQSIAFEIPFIGTVASDGLTEASHAYVQEETTLIDTVKYTGLSAGDEYTVIGVLMDKATGKPLLVDGEQVTASNTFTAEAEEGSTEVAFVFNSSNLRGKDVVVFEKLYLGEVEIAVHEDIEDIGQTIQFLDPEIGTTAIDRATGNHKADTSKQTIIADTITYKGLKVGDEYTIEGVLMDKATGKELLIGGKPVTASATFTAKKTDGSIELEFIFDSSGLEGKSVVVFESLYYKELEVAVHADITDKDQTVKFNTPSIFTIVPQTGDPGFVPFVLTIMACVVLLAAGLSYMVIRRRKSDKQDEEENNA